MPKSDTVRLRHMLDAAEEAVAFTVGKERADLDADRMLTLALVKCIEIIGEAASRVSEPCRNDLSRIPWGDVITMRHRLIHAYYDVDLDIVWSTVTQDLPPLVNELETTLEQECT